MDEERLLALGLFDFRDPKGANISERCVPLGEWVDESSNAGLFQFLRHHEAAPDIRSSVVAWGGQRYEGLNFASQDYLGLSRHPVVVEAAAQACLAFGTHSAGSEPMGGGLAAAKELERSLAEFVEHDHVVLFPTGWAAGYGAIKALIRPYDYVVLDALAHDCLQHGANASTKNVSLFAHNDLQSLRKRLDRTRRLDPDSAILVITESLFSMDSDHADLRELTLICKEFGATTLVDVAHDLGALGPQGKGVLAESGVLSDVDFLVGSFSKTFACIGGFFASHSKAATYYVRGFSGSYTFSNYLIPPQVAAIHTALRIIRQPLLGEELRTRTHRNAQLLRDELANAGFQVLGRTSPLVLPLIGEERIARRAHRSCLEGGLILNNIEFPACRRGAARFRLQLTPNHTSLDVSTAVEILARSIHTAKTQS